ncbi:hypothetical protein ACHAXS_013271 [Conticribra weissflogii]
MFKNFNYLLRVFKEFVERRVRESRPRDQSRLTRDLRVNELDPWSGQDFGIQIHQVLYHQRSRFQDILVFESAHHGRVLVLDGVIKFTEREKLSYQEMIAHIPLCSHRDPKKVLVVGGGDGGVLREIARHPEVEEIVICELDEDVIRISKEYLPFLARGFDDPRVTVRIKPSAAFMRENQGAFDVIIVDSSDPVRPASVLLETPFYRAIHDCLRDGGIVCMLTECERLQPLVPCVRRLFETVEYASCLIPRHPTGQIAFIVATKKGGGNDGRGCKVPVRRLKEEASKELSYYTRQIHRAAFVLPAFVERAISGEDEKETKQEQKKHRFFRGQKVSSFQTNAKLCVVGIGCLWVCSIVYIQKIMLKMMMLLCFNKMQYGESFI